MAFWRYMVDATLPRCARLGAMLVRPAVLVEAMEERKSGRKKCCSEGGIGTGHTRRGRHGGDRRNRGDE